MYCVSHKETVDFSRKLAKTSITLISFWKAFYGFVQAVYIMNSVVDFSRKLPKNFHNINKFLESIVWVCPSCLHHE